MAKKKNEPIVLSGRVYLDGILAEELPGCALPAKLLAGDIKLHNVRKEGRRQRFGRTITFTGFIVGSVYDGKSFRRLLLRKLAAVESTHTGPVEMRERSATIVRYLRTLVRREAVWFEKDHGYEVTRNTIAVPPPTASAPAAPAAEQPAVKASAPGAPVEAASVVCPNQSHITPVRPKVTAPAATKRRHRRKAVDENQLPLFTNLE